ncbi:equilibrative nucleobase transporter 1-like [Mixophyes fleayi]|uniref:equilibrative nucleobase transporter 1-like n=1 Tax=Mixophyes fleayi TaxID=3061075 RepID=UPI003F4DF328
MRCQRALTLITGFIECLCFVGVTFGWASLLFVLKNEKYFQNLCLDIGNQTSNATAGCSSQDERFSTIFTVASSTNSFIALPCGYMFDRLGTAVTRSIAILLYTMATLLIALSTPDTAVLLFPAMCLLVTGGLLLMLTNMQVGNLFSSQRSTIITLYNGAYDSSSVIFLIVKVLYQNGISLKTQFLFISSCSVCHILRTIFLMPKKHIPFPLPEGYSYGLNCANQDLKTSESKQPLARYKTMYHATDHPGTSVIKQEKPADVSFRSCVLSSLFIWHLLWLSLMQLRNLLFIGTLNPVITRLSGGDPDIVSKYTNVFAVCQFFGVLCAPWNGLIMDRHKRKQKDTDRLDDLHSSILSLSLTTALCVLFSVCASVPTLPALYPTFIIQVITRSFLYGGNAAFLAIVFPPRYFGKLYGLALTLSALIATLQYPVFHIIQTHLGGDPFYVNIALLILMLLTILHPINVFRVCKQEKREREATERQYGLY